GMVKAPEEYPYSSARAHITGVPDEVLSDELITEDGRSSYIEFVKAPSPWGGRGQTTYFIMLVFLDIQGAL
ncbi:MAG: hypothetical protein HZA49_10460, partial [Planctomycetes bacterium]|nr:hypothetical protein [Planctomycetota bacterium]